MRRLLIESIIAFVVIGMQIGIAKAWQYDYEYRYYRGTITTEIRDACDYDGYVIHGRASVSESSLFKRGIRLTASARDGEDFEPGLAAAVYRFDVPSYTSYLKIEVRYRDISRDDWIAGRLWIRSTEKEEEVVEVGEDKPVYRGDTFLLPSDSESQAFHLPAKGHMVDNHVEIHLVAEGRDCLEVRDIKVEYLREAPSIRVITRHYPDYWDLWPRYRYVYHYWYWGPIYRPIGYCVYEVWVFPKEYYWLVWRPWFRTCYVAHPSWRFSYYRDIYVDPPDDKDKGSRSEELGRIRVKEEIRGRVPVTDSRTYYEVKRKETTISSSRYRYTGQGEEKGRISYFKPSQVKSSSNDLLQVRESESFLKPREVYRKGTDQRVISSRTYSSSKSERTYCSPTQKHRSYGSTSSIGERRYRTSREE